MDELTKPVNTHAGAESGLNGGLAAEFVHEGQRYITVQANGCDKCEFFWRDGGIYDACDHPDRELAKRTCWAPNRTEGINLSWEKSEAANVELRGRAL
jgi:hypothetical protein